MCTESIPFSISIRLIKWLLFYHSLWLRYSSRGLPYGAEGVSMSYAPGLNQRRLATHLQKLQSLLQSVHFTINTTNVPTAKDTKITTTTIAIRIPLKSDSEGGGAFWGPSKASEAVEREASSSVVRVIYNHHCRSVFPTSTRQLWKVQEKQKTKEGSDTLRHLPPKPLTVKCKQPGAWQEVYYQ